MGAFNPFPGAMIRPLNPYGTPPMFQDGLYDDPAQQDAPPDQPPQMYSGVNAGPITPRATPPEPAPDSTPPPPRPLLRDVLAEIHGAAPASANSPALPPQDLSAGLSQVKDQPDAGINDYQNTQDQRKAMNAGETPGYYGPSNPPQNDPNFGVAPIVPRQGPPDSPSMEQFRQLQRPEAPPDSGWKTGLKTALGVFLGPQLAKDIVHPVVAQQERDYEQKRAELAQNIGMEQKQQQLQLTDLQKKAAAANLQSEIDARATRAAERPFERVEKGWQPVAPDEVQTPDYVYTKDEDGKQWKIETPATKQKRELQAKTDFAEQNMVEPPPFIAKYYPSLKGKKIPYKDIEALTTSALKAKELESAEAATLATFNQTIDQLKLRPELDSRTKALVAQRIAEGDKKGAWAIIDEAHKEMGRTETAKATAEATAPTKIQITQAGVAARAPQVADEGLDLMAEKYLADGQVPSRNPILIAQVTNLAAQKAKARGMDSTAVVLERNAALANKTALTSVTKQYETLKPFADMAEKNATILEQKSKLVADLGIPLLNTPLRSLGSSFAGNKNVAAFRAALLPVQADFARILNSPTGAGVLTDNARKEMEGAIAPGATVAQIKSALDVFRTDAKNRREAYEATIADLKGKTAVMGPSNPGPANGANGNKIPTITTKAERDALPSGSKYIRDGVTYTKP